MINKLRFAIQNKNKTIIKMTGATDSSKRTMNYEIMQDPGDESYANSPFQSVQIRTVGASDASPYILHIDWLLQGSERKFKYFDSANFNASFINIPLQLRDMSDRAQRTSCVFQGNNNEVEL